MELVYVFIILIVDFSYIVLAFDQPDPPTDVRIDIIDDTAKISWVIPSNQGIIWSRINLNNSKEGDVYLDSGKKHKFVRFPHSSFEIANLKMCSEYCVRITCISRSTFSKSTTQKFWMTNTTFTAEIDENIDLTWRTSFSYDHPFYVMTPTREILFSVLFGSLITNKYTRKYEFDNMPQDVRSINITVMSVKQRDAGLYGSVDDDRFMNGCCVLVVTNKFVCGLDDE